MTDQEINRKIAELCGWKREKRKRWGGTDNVDGWGRNQHLSLGHKDRQFTTWLEGHTPNYCSDLNAMQEIIFELSGTDRVYFIDVILSHINCEPDYNIDDDFCSDDGWKLAMATARQRAEAFLRVKGKWSE